MSVHNHPAQTQAAPPPAPPNGGNGDVRERLKALETEMRHVATKADLKATESSLIKWMMGAIAASTITLVVASVMFLVRFLGSTPN